MDVGDCYISNLIDRDFSIGKLLFTDAFPNDKRIFTTQDARRHYTELAELHTNDSTLDAV